ncbi:DJ-1/PfpI family protein [Nocardioides sp. GXZ039]|uniref:DJ-1/PfpI family protein n=1 Tax=Nocardioides sp. GXZ039 TaxID=3136018 RepID=UPI0030F39931
MTQSPPARTVHVAVFDTLADWEIGYLAAHLRNGHFQNRSATWEIAYVGATDQPVTTMGGLRVVPDLTLADLDPAESAMLVLPGGETWDSPALAGFVEAARRFLDSGTPVAAICGATYALAVAGLLDERTHTSNDASFLASSGYAGADRYAGVPAVVDGDLVTASGIAPVAFARAVFERLGSHDPGVLDSWTKLYADGDPAGYFELMSA